MVTYLERYLALDKQGMTFEEYQATSRSLWAELIGMGSLVFEEELYADVQAFARAIMGRAGHNVATLRARLDTLGYPFDTPDSAWLPPDAAFLKALDDFEARCGPLPLLLRALMPRSLWRAAGPASFSSPICSAAFAGAASPTSARTRRVWPSSGQLSRY